MTRQLTDNFHMNEFLHSDTAKARGIDNSPAHPTHDSNLVRLAEAMEDVRKILDDASITITSGYRSPSLNEAVGGAQASAHLEGLACDFTCPDFGKPLEICQKLRPHMEVLGIDQLIFENVGGYSWVHLGLAGEDEIPRQMCLTITDSGTREGFA